MPRNFEGNLAQQLPQEEAKPTTTGRRKRSSGIVEVKELDPSELKLVELGKKAGYQDLNPADLEPENGEVVEDLNPNDLEEEVEDLNPDDFVPEKEEATDVTDEAKEEDSAEALAELRASDERKKESLSRRAAHETVLAGRKQKLERTIQAKKEIEVQHAKEMIALEQEAAAKGITAEEEHGENMAFLNSAEGRRSIRESMAEELEAVRSEYKGSDAELLKTESGEVRGLKNVLLVHRSAFREAMAARMNAIRVETLRTLEEPSSINRDMRLKALEAESREWMLMYKDEKIIEESGNKPENYLLHNRFYKHIDLVVPEGLDQSDVETLAITPENELDRRMEVLKKQDKVITDLLERASEVLWNIEETDEGKSARQKQALADFLRGAEEYRVSRKEEVAREVAFLESLEAPDKLDLRSQRLNMLIAQGEESIAHLQTALGKTKEKASVEAGKEAIDEIEGKVSGYKEDLTTWHQHPVRQEAMEARRLDLQEKIQNLQNREEWEDLFATIHVQEANGRGRIREKSSAEVAQQAKEAKENYLERVHAAKSTVIRLAREKAENAEMQAAIINERVSRELDMLEITVDLNDLSAPEEPEGIDVDVDVVEEAPEFTKPSKIKPAVVKSMRKAA